MWNICVICTKALVVVLTGPSTSAFGLNYDEAFGSIARTRRNSYFYSYPAFETEMQAAAVAAEQRQQHPNSQHLWAPKVEHYLCHPLLLGRVPRNRDQSERILPDVAIE